MATIFNRASAGGLLDGGGPAPNFVRFARLPVAITRTCFGTTRRARAWPSRPMVEGRSGARIRIYPWQLPMTYAISVLNCRITSFLSHKSLTNSRKVPIAQIILTATYFWINHQKGDGPLPSSRSSARRRVLATRSAACEFPAALDQIVALRVL